MAQFPSKTNDTTSGGGLKKLQRNCHFHCHDYSSRNSKKQYQSQSHDIQRSLETTLITDAAAASLRFVDETGAHDLRRDADGCSFGTVAGETELNFTAAGAATGAGDEAAQTDGTTGD
jgi:hypothetical protein